MGTWRYALPGIALVLGAAILAACGSGGEAVTTESATPTIAPPSATVAAPEPTPTTPRTPEPMPAVVQSLLERIASARNLAAPDRLEARIISRDELPAVLEAAFTDDDRRWFAETTTLYRLLGYLDADEDYYDIYMRFATAAVIGLYDTGTGRLYVVADGGRGWDDLTSGQRETLAHEIVHALQDYHFDLSEVFRQTLDDRDQNLAYLAVVEGDAVTHEAIANDRRSLLPAGRFVALADFTLAAAVSAPIERELRFPYTTGVDWIRNVKQAGGTAAIDDLLRDPPATTAVILHPERGARWQPDRPPLPDLGQALGDGWERRPGGSFGEFHWMNLLQTRLRGLDAAMAAAAWTGDRYDVYVDDSHALAAFSVRAGEPLGDAVSRWVGEDAAAGVAVALAGGRSAAFAKVPGGFVLVIGTDRAAVEAAVRALTGG